MEGVTKQISEIPKVVTKTPLLFVGLGLFFLILVLVVEAYKPGLLTGPISHLLTSIGIKSASA